MFKKHYYHFLDFHTANHYLYIQTFLIQIRISIMLEKRVKIFEIIHEVHRKDSYDVDNAGYKLFF